MEQDIGEEITQITYRAFDLAETFFRPEDFRKRWAKRGIMSIARRACEKRGWHLSANGRTVTIK